MKNILTVTECKTILESLGYSKNHISNLNYSNYGMDYKQFQEHKLNSLGPVDKAIRKVRLTQDRIIREKEREKKKGPRNEGKRKKKIWPKIKGGRNEIRKSR